LRRTSALPSSGETPSAWSPTVAPGWSKSHLDDHHGTVGLPANTAAAGRGLRGVAAVAEFVGVAELPVVFRAGQLPHVLVLVHFTPPRTTPMGVSPYP